MYPNITFNIPSQALLAHVRLSNEFPKHGRPPFWGAGLLQERDRYCFPPPQVLVQVVYEPKLPHSPLIGTVSKIR